jgi:hypothetical protein
MPQGYSPFQGLARGLKSGMRLGLEASALKERKEEREMARTERAEIRSEDVKYRSDMLTNQAAVAKATAANRAEQLRLQAAGARKNQENIMYNRDPIGFNKALILKLDKRAADPNVGPHERNEIEVEILRLSRAIDRFKAKHSRPPTTRERKSDGKIVTEEYDPETKKWNQIGTTPRFQAKTPTAKFNILAAGRSHFNDPKKNPLPKELAGWTKNQVEKALEAAIGFDWWESFMKETLRSGGPGATPPTPQANNSDKEPPTPQIEIPIVDAPEDAMKLPLGTIYMTPDGKKFRR